MPIRAAVFVNCLSRGPQPRLMPLMTAVLETLGVIVVHPEGQTCCGLPLLSDGLTDDACTLARQWLRRFEDFDCIITPSPACCAMVREHFPPLLEGDQAWEAGQWKVAGRVYEFLEFVTTVLKFDLAQLRLPVPVRCVFQPPCQRRLLEEVPLESRALSRIQNLEKLSIGEIGCCGGAGGLPRLMPERAIAIARKNAAVLQAGNPDEIICGETICSLHLQQAIDAAPIKHPVEIIAAALGIAVE